MLVMPILGQLLCPRSLAVTKPRNAISRISQWLAEREAFRPALWIREVPAITLWQHYFYRCFGGLALLMFSLQVVTGLFLLAYYQPTTQGAWTSLMHLDNQVAGGWILRRLHAVGGNMLVMFALLHMVRVLWNSAYKEPRELNWLSGLALLVCAMATAASGQVLAWNQSGIELANLLTGVWQSVPWIGGSLVSWIRGGEAVGGVTLGRFFAMHLALPVAMTLFLKLHWSMIRRLGVSRPL
jgi:quinol-cytochrome oxidoreductase complex cytochrome b subunit